MQSTQAVATVSLELEGELDFGTSRVLTDLDLDDVVARGGRRLVVDLQRVVFIDSSGIGALIHVRNDAVARGLDFSLTTMPVSVERTLVMAGLADLFDLNAHV